MADQASTQPFDVTGKIAIVTGGGRGLGRAMAIGLADAGAKVAVAGRTQAGLDETVALIAERGGEASAHLFDAASFAECDGLMDAVAEAYGRVDVVVVSHGIGDGAPAEIMPEAQWRNMIDIDLTSVFACAQSAGKRMLAQEGGGSIILISSTNSLTAFFGTSAYGAAKAGVDHLCRNLAFEWAQRGVRVNTINPGFMTTHMRGTEGFYDDPAYKKMIEDRTPMGRKGAPEELVGPVLFFASDASSFVTGHVLPVDGGWCLGLR